jgi:hypothetical protein
LSISSQDKGEVAFGEVTLDCQADSTIGTCRLRATNGDYARIRSIVLIRFQKLG